MGEPHPKGAQRCHARSKTTGQQCRQAVVPGATVCHYHGGAAPQVQEAARERLRAMIHPALQAWAELLEQTEFPTVRFSTAREVVNHEFGKPAESVSLEHSGEVAYRWLSQNESS